MSLIRFEDLSFSYKTASGAKVPVLKKINLTIEAGELIAIQGPSGSGKSTLLYIIGCLLKSYSGKVEIGGQNISQRSDEQLAVLRNRHIGFVFQQFHLLPKATVAENILLPSYYPSEKPQHAFSSQRMEKLIDELGLRDRRHHYPNQLSGGQQQRVSIARALLNNTQIILADEPTGSLDTQNSKQIIDLLKLAHESGRTVIIITHDLEIAQQCDKVVHFRDGEIEEIVVNRKIDFKVQHIEGFQDDDTDLGNGTIGFFSILSRYFYLASTLLPLAFRNLKQNRSRSLLTMLGIVIGVAAVLSMVTLGSFTKRKILDSYTQMGVNTFIFYGYPNWDLRATDRVPVVFQSFELKRDLEPLKKVFPDLVRLSPTLSSWNNRVFYGGKTIDSDVRVLGVTADALLMTNRQLVLGTNFSPFHIESRSPVCLIGFDIYQRLFSNVSPLGQIISITQQSSAYGCRVIGVLEKRDSNKEWDKPNLQLILPYTFLAGVTEPWNARIREVMMQVKEGADVEKVGKQFKAYFNMKFGKSARFDVGSDGVLIAQMNKFLSLFTVLLAAIALVSLAVGGIGITNMMLVSVSERFKEIGIRKAFGATDFSIRVQYLVESLLICSIAGLIGLILGFVLYQSAIYGATKFVSKLNFEWTFDSFALIISVVSILVVGVLSGITPALKAEKLQVIEALRSE